MRARNEEAMAQKNSRLYVESRQKSKNMREAMREQKQRSRQLIVACARKMQEQEVEIEQVCLLLHFVKWTTHNFTSS